MKPVALTVFAAGLLLSCNLPAKDNICGALRDFVNSVQPEETRLIRFHTNWGGNFKDTIDPKPVLYSKRCDHYEYPQAKAVCAALMEHGAIEFAGSNAKDALICLSPETRIAPGVQLEIGEFNFSYGTDYRGSNVTIKLNEDTELGGMVLDIAADGY